MIYMARRRRKKSIFSFSKGLDLGLDLNEDLIREMFAICWVVLGLIMLLAVFNVAGLVGREINLVLHYIFGVLAFLVPILMIWIGLGIGSFFNTTFKMRVVVAAVMLLVAAPPLVHLMIGGNPLAVAKQGGGGGLFGYLISLRLTQLIGGVGAFILTATLLFIGLLMLLNISMRAFASRLFFDSSDENVKVNGGQAISLFSSVKRTIGGLKDNIRPARAKVLEMAGQNQERSSPSRLSSSNFILPSIDILEVSNQVASSGNINKNVEIVQKTLKDFGIDVAMSDVNVGPTVTQYTMKPAEGVKLSQITARANDLALALAAKSIRIEAPIPGKSAVGVEIPNKVPARVTLREVLESKEFGDIQGQTAIALGRDVAGTPVAVELEKMPHLLIAGATGSGKSVCINSIILTFLMRNTPQDLRLIIVDPKRVELTNYNGIPHLMAPVITEVDKTIAALKWTVAEMDRRYRLFADSGKRNILAYNQDSGEKLPYIVFIVDELADLMAVSAREVEGSVVRLAQMARATGIHLILATQRPSVDVITGLIKANITSRIAFAVASNADSRTILDQGGAEKLLGNGDMLFIGSDLNKPKRVQGAFASDSDISKVIGHVKSQDMVQYVEEVTTMKSSVLNKDSQDHIDDSLYNEAADTVMAAGKASASLLQRRLRIGYARAARLLDILEENGVIGPADGAKPREVYRSDINQNSF